MSLSSGSSSAPQKHNLGQLSSETFPMAHLGFARKYRPQDFDEIVGQAAVSTTLKNAVTAKQPAHAYLFFGPRGVGKTTTARILAKALNCEKGPTPEPCGKCAACREIAQGSSIDVLELDAATHTQVDKIREMIVETASLAPSRDRYKIFIIDEVHMLSTASFNALLKTLEEPPAHVVFILATTDPGKIPATIVSRCQRFRFRPLPLEVLAGHLQRLAKTEKISVEAAAVDLLARSAGGSLRDAVSLLEQAAAYAGGKVEAEKVRELLGSLPEELLMSLTKAILIKDASAMAAALEQSSEEGYDPGHVLRDLRERLHASHLFRLGVEEGLGASWRDLVKPYSAETFSFLVARVSHALENIRLSDSPRLSLEISLFGLLESAYDVEDWLARLEALEQRLNSNAPIVTPSQKSMPAAPAPVEHVRPAKISEGAPKTVSPREQLSGRQTRIDAPGTAGEDAHSSPRQPSSDAGVWTNVLSELQTEKPGLAHDLEASRIVAGPGSQWRLIFSNAFLMERAQNNLKMIEVKLARAAGRPIQLRLEVESGSFGDEQPAAQSRASIAADGEKPPALEETTPAEDPAVKKVLEFFPGKVRHLKKK